MEYHLRGASAPAGTVGVTVLLTLVFLAGSTSTLVVGTLADPLSLDPHRATDLVSEAVAANVCEPLVRQRPDGRAEAVLAASWASRDARSWTFTLRPGVRFHDGTPLDADAVVANLQALRRHRGFAGRAVRAGPAVVSVALDRPDAALLATLSQPFYCMLSPRALAPSSPSPSPAPLVGTGPFRVASVRRGEVRLAAHPAYWGGAPRLREVVFRRLANADALARALVAGEIDVTSALTQAQVQRLKARPDLALDARTGMNVAFLSINNERRPFTDVRVRQALARAVDREALVRTVLGGQGEPARNPLPPSFWGYATRTKELTLDRGRARRLLAEAGLASGFATTLLVTDVPRPYLPDPLGAAARIRDDLAEVGVRVRVQQVPSWGQYLDRARRGDYDLALLGWQADTVDPNDFLSALLASDSIGSTNRSRYRSRDLDALLVQGRRATDTKQRATAYRAAQALFQRDMPWVPLYHAPLFTVYRRAVRALAMGPTAIARYEDVWKAQ